MQLTVENLETAFNLESNNDKFIVPGSHDLLRVLYIASRNNVIDGIEALGYICSIPSAVIGVLNFLSDEDIPAVTALAAVVNQQTFPQAASVERMKVWIARQTVRKTLRAKGLPMGEI